MIASQILEVLNNSQVSSNIVEVERTAIGWILNWVRIIGTGMALIMLTYMALVYINVGPDKKAQMKSQLTNYCVGAIVLIGASNILYYIEQLVEFILKDVFF